MNEEIRIKYQELFDSYIQAKPIINELYIRNGEYHLDATLNEMRAMLDHISRCYGADVTDEVCLEQINRASNHLKRLLYDCFKQLNIVFFDTFAELEKQEFGYHWLVLDGGNFWKEYVSLRKKIVEYIKNAKIEEYKNSENALKLYQEAYVLQSEVYSLIENNKDKLQLSKLKKICNRFNSMKWWLWTTILTAVLPSVIYEFWSHRVAIVQGISTLWYDFLKTLATLIEEYLK